MATKKKVSLYKCNGVHRNKCKAQACGGRLLHPHEQACFSAYCGIVDMQVRCVKVKEKMV